MGPRRTVRINIIMPSERKKKLWRHERRNLNFGEDERKKERKEAFLGKSSQMCESLKKKFSHVELRQNKKYSTRTRLHVCAGYFLCSGEIWGPIGKSVNRSQHNLRLVTRAHGRIETAILGQCTAAKRIAPMQWNLQFGIVAHKWGEFSKTEAKSKQSRT